MVTLRSDVDTTVATSWLFTTAFSVACRFHVTRNKLNCTDSNYKIVKPPDHASTDFKKNLDYYYFALGTFNYCEFPIKQFLSLTEIQYSLKIHLSFITLFFMTILIT